MSIVNKLILNGDYENNPHKTLVNALNVVYDKSFTFLVNENGYSKLHTFDHQICGVIPTPLWDIVFTTNNTTICRIYKVNNTTKTLLLQGKFNFKTANSITGVYDYNNNGNLIISWTDGINPIGLLNIDNFITYDNTPILPDNYVDTIYLFPNVNIPTYNLDTVRSGGNIKRAAYYFVINYYINDYDLSNWLTPSQPVYIFDISSEVEQNYFAYEKEGWHWGNNNEEKVSNKSFDSYQTTDSETSNKSIILNLENLDTRYSKVKIAVIQKTDTSSTAFDIGDYPINNGNIKVTYDGFNYGELSISEVTIPYLSYKSAETITKLNGRLLIANLKSNNILDYQKYANNIKVTYDVETLVPNEAMETRGIYNYYDTENKCFYLKSVMPDEVYALYIGLIGKDGSSKGNFHIPGRHSRAISNVNNTVMPIGTREDSLLDSVLLRGVFPSKYYDIDNSVKIFHLFDTADNRSTSTPASCNFNINTLDISSIPGNKGECNITLNLDTEIETFLTITFDKTAFEINSYDTIHTRGTSILTIVDNINNSSLEYIAEYVNDTTLKLLAPLSYGSNSNLIITTVTSPDLLGDSIINDFHDTLLATDTIGVDTGSIINVYIIGTLIGTYIIKPNDTKELIHQALVTSINNYGLYTSSYLLNKVYIYPDILLGPNVINNNDYKLNITNNSSVTFTKSEYFTGGSYNNYHGYLGYWENKDEVYPDTDSFDIYDVDVDGEGQVITTGDDVINGIATLRNKNVRHHKIPSYNYIYNNTDIVNKIITLKIYDIKFPNDILDEIQGFYIMYAARDTSNMTIIGTCPLITDTFYEALYYSHSKYIRFNDFGLVNLKTQLGKCYIKTIYRETPITNSESEYTKQFSKIDTLYNEIHTVKSAKYVPYDNSATTPDNTGKEESLILELDYTYNNTDINIKTIANLCIYNPNPFNSFYKQQLCIAGNINIINEEVNTYTVSKLKGFDTYLNSQLIRLYRGNQKLIYGTDTIDRNHGDDGDGTTVFNEFIYPSYSIINVLAKISTATITEIESTKQSGFWLFTNDDNLVYYSTFSIDPTKPDVVIYPLFYSAVNNIKYFEPYNPNNIFVDNHPNRIHRSAVQSKESLTSNWRYLSILEYYETIKDKGEILNIQGASDLLLIHCKYSLLVATLKDRLELKSSDVYLGQADIFDREPKELKPSDNAYCGIQSKLSAKLTDTGYIFYNPYTKNIYIYSNEGFIIINNSTNNEYINTIFNSSEAVKSFYNNHVLFGEDTEYKRLFIVNKDTIDVNLSFDYSHQDKGFISKHTPVPVLYFNSIRGNFAVDSTGLNIYKTNIGTKGLYFDAVKQQSYVDVLLNNKEGIKQLQGLSFITSNDNSNALNKLVVYTKNQCTKEYTIADFSTIFDFDKARYNKGRWYYNLIRDYSTDTIVQDIIKDFELDLSVIDLDKQWFELSMLEDNYFIVRLISNNNTDIVFKDVEYDFIKL